MKIIVFKDANERPIRFNVNQRTIATAAALASLTLLTCAVFGFWLSHAMAPEEVASLDELEQARQELALQRKSLNTLKRQNQYHLDALAMKMGDLQARTTRVEALGSRLTELGNLDDGEFNFDIDPPIGGPDEAGSYQSIGSMDLERELLNLESRLNSQHGQLSLLESMIINRELDSRMEPSGRPVESGWLSSRYGPRADPFTGEPSNHYGIDFAGKLEAPIVSVADGVVIWSGKRVGYGNVVDIDHGNGYVTRYAHNHSNLVKVGQRVATGEQIALMGTTGRATSPHVHFEVWLDGKRINPTNIVKRLAS